MSRKKPSASTSWDPVANWYKEWVGRDGSIYHRQLAIPAVLDLLDPKPHETVLDIGCGTGVLANALDDSVRYVGVDASPRLLSVARRTVRTDDAPRTFYQGDARRLKDIKGIEPGTADGVVFLLSIQDMAPLDDILAGASWATKKGGRIVILMMHPCFRVPRQSGWGWDEKRNLQFRRIDSYLSPMEVPVRPIAKGKPGSIKSFHLPLHEYINGLIDTGFSIQRIVEIPAFPAIKRKGPQAKAQNRSNREIPTFLGILGVKTPLNLNALGLRLPES